MATDVSKPGATNRAMLLQDRIIAAANSVIRPQADNCGSIKNPLDFYLSIRRYLIKAVDCGIIRNPRTEVFQHLVKWQKNEDTLLIAVGSVRNFNRVKSLPHFHRKDGGWFDFQLEVATKPEGVEVLWYDFELRLPEGSPIPFVRLDLNPWNHDNVERARRSHLHLGSDDDGWSVPMAVLSPYEVLDLFLHNLVTEGRVRRLNT